MVMILVVNMFMNVGPLRFWWIDESEGSTENHYTESHETPKFFSLVSTHTVNYIYYLSCGQKLIASNAGF